jgi:hypothetical protein
VSTSRLDLSPLPDAGAFVDEAYRLVANRANDPGCKSHNDWVRARVWAHHDAARALFLLRRALRRRVGEQHPLFIAVSAALEAARRAQG